MTRSIEEWLAQPTSAAFNLALTSLLIPGVAAAVLMPLGLLAKLVGILSPDPDGTASGLVMLALSSGISVLAFIALRRIAAAWLANLREVLGR